LAQELKLPAPAHPPAEQTVSALWQAGEAWAQAPEDPDLRNRYLALRPKGLQEAGHRLLIAGPPDQATVTRLATHLAQRGLQPVRWDHPLAGGEAALILGRMDADQRRQWLDVLPKAWPLAIAVDPRTPAGWQETAQCLAQGHAPLPILPTHAIPGASDGPEVAIRRWQTMAADTLAPVMATGEIRLPRLMQPDGDGHTDLAAAALLALGTVGCVYPGQEAGDAHYWLSTSGMEQGPSGALPWPWVFPLGGMWFSAPPTRMAGPDPVPEKIVCAGRGCRIQRTEKGWSAKLPDLGPGWHEVTATLATGTVSWRFGHSPHP
jgi:hypothetical protein